MKTILRPTPAQALSMARLRRAVAADLAKLIAALPAPTPKPPTGFELFIDKE